MVDDQEHWGIMGMPLPVQKMLAEFIGMTLFVFLVTSTQPCHTSALVLVLAYWYDSILLVGHMHSSVFALSMCSYSLCCLQGPSAAINGGETLQIAFTFGMAIFVSSQPPRAASHLHRCTLLCASSLFVSLLYLQVLACAIGHTSGGQMNCAVTLALVITGDLVTE